MRIRAIIEKEIFHLRRDPRALYFALFWPVILLLIFGYTVNMDIKNIRIGFIDLDQTSESRELLQVLKNTNYFQVTYYSSFSWQSIKQWLEQGNYQAVLLIPSGFSQKLLRSENSDLQILVDGSDNNTARILLGYLQGAAEHYYQTKVTAESNRFGVNFSSPVTYSFRFLYNPSLRSQNFIIPGLIAVIMMIIGTILTSLTIAGEWDRGTMEQLFYTPIKSYELILGKLLPYFGLGVFQMTLVLLTGIFIFRVPFQGSILLFYFASALFLVAALGFGLFISLISKKQQVAAMLAFLTTMLPAFLLSGFIFPISSMPTLLQVVSYLVPARYFLNIIRAVFLKGTNFFALWSNFLALFLFSAISFGVSVKIFRKRLD